MSKNPNVFLIHFIRLGVLQRITEMVNESEEVEIDEIIEGKMAKKVVFQTTMISSFLFHCNVKFTDKFSLQCSILML